MASVKPPLPEENDPDNRSRRSIRTYESRSSFKTDTLDRSTYQAENVDRSYRSTITPRRIIIQRTASPVRQMSSSTTSSTSHPIPWGRSKSVCMERGQLLASAPPGAFKNIVDSGVTSVKSAQHKEKKDMQDLNERLASYIEKMKFLEAQNRRLAEELAKLRARWGKETSQVKAMYEAELDEARKCLDDGDKVKSKLEIKVTSLEEQLDELRRRLRDVSEAWSEERERNSSLSVLLRDSEQELNTLRRRLEYMESDRIKDKKMISTLQDALKRVRFDLDNETLLRIDAENRSLTFEEEIEFLKAVHEQEMKEMMSLVYRDTTVEHREFWKNEMGHALREIQEVYDEKLGSMKSELDTFYNMKIQQFKTDSTRQNVDSARLKEESTKFKTQVTELRSKIHELEAKNAALTRELELLKRDAEAREQELESESLKYKMEVARLSAELEAILIELQSVLDSKFSLELEISTYRKLLEGEETRSSIVKTVDQYSNSHYTRSERGGSVELTSTGGVSRTGRASSNASCTGVSITVGTAGGATRHSSGSSGITAGTDTTTTKVTQVVKGEVSAKTINSRSAKGHLVIAENASDGTSVTIENTGKKDEVLDGWRLRRNVDGEPRPDFLFQSTIIKPQSKLKIWAKGCRPLDFAHSSDLEYSETSWGCGLQVSTKLTNPNSEDRASHMQKKIYLSTLPVDGSQNTEQTPTS